MKVKAGKDMSLAELRRINDQITRDHKAINKSRAQMLEAIENREWLVTRSLWGNANWALFYVIISSREGGKTTDVQKYLVNQFLNRNARIYWLRLKESQTNKLLANNGEKFLDPIVKKYIEEKKHRWLCLSRKGDDLFWHDKKFVTILALSTAHNVKGVNEFDGTVEGLRRPIIVVIDEFQLEKGERRTLDVLYALVTQLENIVRSRKRNIKIIFLGNTTEEASDVLSCFEFIPEKFGVFKLKSKKCVIMNVKPSRAYQRRRKGSVGDILAGNASNYTNERYIDTTLIYKGRLEKPTVVIKFSKDPQDWYTVWDSNIIARYNGEQKSAIAMRRYIDNIFSPELRDNVFALYDARAYRFRNLLTQTTFGYELSLLKTK